MVKRGWGILTYERCREIYTNGSKRRSLVHPIPSVRLADNTVLLESTTLWEVSKTVAYAVYFYGTPIVTYHFGGAIILNSGGNMSATTKSRLCEFSPVTVYQKKGVWYVDHLEFYDGMNVGMPQNYRDWLEAGQRRGVSGLEKTSVWLCECANSLVVAIANTAIANRNSDGTYDPTDLGVLADALEEVGYDHEDGGLFADLRRGFRGVYWVIPYLAGQK